MDQETCPQSVDQVGRSVRGHLAITAMLAQAMGSERMHHAWLLTGVKGIGKAKAERIIAALELGKRLARFHATREKITSPSDVADLMMSRTRAFSTTSIPGSARTAATRARDTSAPVASPPA